jgi:hypothetical protein
MIEAELADGTVLEFPKGTDPAVIQKTVKRVIAERQPKPMGRPRDIVGQPAMTMAGSVLGDIAGYAAGGGRSIIEGLGGSGTRGLPAGTETRQMVQQATSYAPTSRMGQIGAELIGRGMETIGDYAEEIPAYAAQKGEEYFGDPELAEQTAESVRQRGFLPTVSNRLLDTGMIGPGGYAAINMAPEIAAMLTGGAIGTAKYMRGRKEIADELKAPRGTGRDLVVLETGRDLGSWKGSPVRPEQPKMGRTDAELAPYKLVEGKAVKDETYKPLVRKGIEPQTLTEMKRSSDTTKNAMMEMTDIKQRGLEYRDYAVNHRPADIVGRQLVPQINFLKAKNKQSGRAIKAASEDLKGKYVDFAKPFDDFLTDLESMEIDLKGVLYNETARAELVSGSRLQVIQKIKSLYEGSDIEAMPGFQRPLTNVIYRALNGQNPDAYDLHKMKRFIDNNITYGKAESGLAARVGGILKNLRHDIDSVLDANFDNYRKANETYSETIFALDSLQDVLPKRVQFDVRGFDSALGQELRKLESNYAIRNDLRNAVNNIQTTSAKYGKPYDGDMTTLVAYMTDLDRIFGAPKGSMPGIIDSITEEIRKGKSPREKVVERFTERLAPEDQEAFELLRDMITSR